MLPIIGDMDADVALEILQASVEPLPADTVSGIALKLFIIGGSDTVELGSPLLSETRTCVEALDVPYWLLAVRT
jgi:hypothetical protein